MDAISFVGLEAAARRPVDGLDGGQRRLVELARALCGAPLLLMLDEPASGLDAAQAECFVSLMSSLAAMGLVLLIASDRSAGGAIVGSALFSAGGAWGIAGLALGAYRRAIEHARSATPVQRPWILSGEALAGSILTGVGALIIAWRSARIRNGDFLLSGGGRVAQFALR